MASGPENLDTESDGMHEHKYAYTCGNFQGFIHNAFVNILCICISSYSPVQMQYPQVRGEAEDAGDS